MNRYVAYSPFRISFGGGGTDISPFCDLHGGAVLNTTIDRGVTVSYTPDQYDLEISSRDFLKSFLIGKGNGANDVLNRMSQLFQNRGITKGRLVINSGVPPGSGLGSSSALTTAMLKLIYRIQEVEKTPWEIASEAFQLEHDYFKITLGKQDPFAVSLGDIKYMEFNKEGETSINLSEHSEFVSELERRTLLVYTGNTRESTNVLQEQVEKSQKGEGNVVSNLIKMRNLATEMKDAVENSKFSDFTDALNRGWNLKKQLGKKVSNKRIDQLILHSLENGGEAAKLMGGGSDGFLLVISAKDRVESLQKSLMDYSSFVVRVSFDKEGTRAFKMKDSLQAL